MRLNLLGPVELLGGDGLPVQIGPGKRRAVLAVLALEANQVVEVERILDLCWDGAPPPHARTALQGHVSALRKLLDEDLQLVTRESGYILNTAHGAVDAVEFRELVREAAGLEAAGAQEHLACALALWRGPALADLSGHGLRSTLAQGLEHARRDALASLARARLELGRGAQTVAALRAAVADDPLDEPLISALILSLHQAGMQAEALSVYDTARRTLADQLGVDPGPALRDAHQTVLRGEDPRPAAKEPQPAAPRGEDPAASHGEPRYAMARQPSEFANAAAEAPMLASVAMSQPASAPMSLHTSLSAPESSASALAVQTTTAGRHTNAAMAAGQAVYGPVPSQLPRRPPGFTGRNTELHRLAEQLNTAGLVLVCGPAGVGKTSIALQWAHGAAPRFPHGQLFANLRGFDQTGPLSPLLALGGFLQALGVPERSLPAGLDERAALYRSRLTGRRMLIVLDDAGSLDQIRPLLPGEPLIQTVVTSRHRFDGLVARDGAAVLPVAPLQTEEARDLLARALGRERTQAEPSAVVQLAELCDRLPLALRVAAARLAIRPEWTVADFVAELADEQDRLAALETEDEDLGVTAALELTRQVLPDLAKRLLALLGLHPASEVDIPVTAALLGGGLATARGALAPLVHSSLLRQTGRRRFARHDLVKLYCRELAWRAGPEETAPAYIRLLDYYLAASLAANLSLSAATLFPGHPAQGPLPAVLPEFGGPSDAIAWFREEEPAIRTLITQSAARRETAHLDRAWRLADNMWMLYNRVVRDEDRESCMAAGLAAARAQGSRQGVFQLLIRVASAQFEHGDVEDALATVREGEDLVDASTDATDRCRFLIQYAKFLSKSGDWDAAMERFLEALEILRQLGSPLHEAALLNDFAWNLLLNHQADTALQYTSQSLEVLEGSPERGSTTHAAALHTHGCVLDALGRLEEALGFYQRSFDTAMANGEERYAVMDQRAVGDILFRLGRVEEAREELSKALDQARSSGLDAEAGHAEKALQRLAAEGTGPQR